jgi:hypothetical protein
LLPESDTPPEQQKPEHRGSRDIISDRTANGIIWTVTGIWAVNLVLGMFGQLVGLEYTPSETVNGIFMAVVGGAFIARTKAGGG